MAAFSDDELEEFYRRIEAITDLDAPRRRRPPRAHVECPTPYKDAFGSEAAARDGIERIRVHRRAAATLRCYRCQCGAWHITSSPPRDDLPPRPRRGRH